MPLLVRDTDGAWVAPAVSTAAEAGLPHASGSPWPAYLRTASVQRDAAAFLDAGTAGDALTASSVGAAGVPLLASRVPPAGATVAVAQREVAVLTNAPPRAHGGAPAARHVTHCGSEDATTCVVVCVRCQSPASPAGGRGWTLVTHVDEPRCVAHLAARVQGLLAATPAALAAGSSTAAGGGSDDESVAAALELDLYMVGSYAGPKEDSARTKAGTSDAADMLPAAAASGAGAGAGAVEESSSSSLAAASPAAASPAADATAATGEEDGPSERETSRALVDAVLEWAMRGGDSGLAFHLQLACVLELNTDYAETADGKPCAMGLLVDATTGAVAPPDFALQRANQPMPELRAVRPFATEPDDADAWALLPVFDAVADVDAAGISASASDTGASDGAPRLRIPPFRYAPINRQMALVMSKLPDDRLLAMCSTSPACEPPHFAEHTRAVFRFMAACPSWEASWPRGEAWSFALQEDGTWLRE